MRVLIIASIFFLLTDLTVQAQTISDSEFKWSNNEICMPQGNCSEVFVKVEEAPIISQFKKRDFDSYIKQAIQKLNLTVEQSGIIKLKLLFAKNQSMCITHIGTKSLVLNEYHINDIKNIFNSIIQFQNGKQRNIEVNCQGILYIMIDKGQLDKIRMVNFDIN